LVTGVGCKKWWVSVAGMGLALHGWVLPVSVGLALQETVGLGGRRGFGSAPFLRSSFSFLPLLSLFFLL
jgi:hypothetical protein